MNESEQSPQPRHGPPGRPTSLSVVIPVYNEEETLEVLVERLTVALDGMGGPDELSWQVIFVDDGSTDSSPELLQNFHRRDPRIACVTLSRNFGHQVAISCGLDYARGDAVIAMDGDLQDPPEVLPDLVARWREGYEVVYAVRQKRKENIVKRAAYRSFYWLLNKVSYLDIPLDSGDFSLMDRRVVDLLREMPERNRFVRGLRTWVGFRQTPYEYARGARYAGTSKYTLTRLLRLAFDGLVSYSFVPLRLVSNIGLVVSLSSLGYLGYLTGAYWFGDRAVQGWTSTVSIVLFLGGVQLLALGIIGEYVGRVFDEVKRRPHYVISGVVGLAEDLPPRRPGF